MNKKFILILVVILIIISGGFFYFFRIQQPQQENTCASLDNYTCQKEENCYPSYKRQGPDRDKVGMPVLNFYFDKCLPLTVEEIGKRRSDKGSCEETGGYWMVTYGNPKGFCSKGDR